MGDHLAGIEEHDLADRAVHSIRSPPYGATKRPRLVERIAVRADGVTSFSGEVTFDSLESWAVDALAH